MTRTGSLVSPGWLWFLFSALLASVVTHASPTKDTPLVRSVYQTPVPDRPLALWDRVSDLYALHRREDADLLMRYVQRAVLEEIVGQKPRSASTLEELLTLEKNSPVQDKNLIPRVLSMVSGALDDSSDDSALPRDYRGAVQYRYEGHSVWSDVSDPRRAYLRLIATNNSAHSVNSLSLRVDLVKGSESIEIGCQASIPVQQWLVSGTSTAALCSTGQVSSTKRPGFYTVIETAELLALAKAIEAGEASISIEPTTIYFPSDSLIVSPTGTQPLNLTFRGRTFPSLGNLTCEDKGTCSAERSNAIQHVLWSPQLWLLLIVLVGAGIGYALLRITLELVGGRFGLTVGRSIGVALSLGFIGLAAWSWMLLESHHGADWGGLGYMALSIASAALGISMLLTALFAAP